MVFHQLVLKYPYLELTYFGREKLIEQNTESYAAEDTLSCEYGFGEALAIEEFKEIKDKLHVIDETFGICLKLCIT